MPKKKSKKARKVKLKKGQCILVHPGTWKYKYARCICRYKSGRVAFHKTSACAATEKRSKAAKKGRRRRRRR